MILIVGLGNPKKGFEKTRHNLGFRVIDYFAKKEKFSAFKFFRELNSLISEKRMGRKKIILAKPKVFMNSSGKAIKKIVKKENLKTGNLFVVHDEIDLPLGKIKIAKGRGSAGHKGVESIIKELGTKNFVRFRIGISPQKGKPENLKAFVLGKFSQKEEKILKKVIERACQAIKLAIEKGIEKAMSEFNK